MGCAKSTEGGIKQFKNTAHQNQKEQANYHPYQIKVIEPLQKQNETDHQLFKQFEIENTDEQLNKSGLPKWKPSKAEQDSKVNGPINNSDINIQVSQSVSESKPKKQKVQMDKQMKVIPEDPALENRSPNDRLFIRQKQQGYSQQDLKVKLQDATISQAEVKIPNFFGEDARNQDELMENEEIADIWKFKLTLPKIQILSV